MFQMLFSRLSALIVFMCLTHTLRAQNPIAEYYNGEKGYPAWTDDIRWENRIDMSEYGAGANDFQKFENARDELFAQGGGVLYYPSGIYDFSDAPVDGPDGRGLMLKSGVVIVGETPTGDSDASDGTMRVKTVFSFKFKKMGDAGEEGKVPANWNLIGIMPSEGEELKDVHHVGIAWVKLNGAVIYFGPQMTWGETYASAGAWLSNRIRPDWQNRVPDGTYPLDPFCGAPMNTSEYMGAGNGRFVFGCVLENAALPNTIYTVGNEEADAFFPEKFISRIAIYGSQIFIGNNLLPKPSESFSYYQSTSEGNKRIIYDYGFSMGIDVNKNYCNINQNKWNLNTGGYWKEGAIIKDNWVYNHGNKGFEISGKWVTIQNNTSDRDFLIPGGEIYGIPEGWTLTTNGYKTHKDNGSSDGFLNRAFDLAGKAIWVDNNEYYKTGTPYPSNDGEGILCQLHGGTWILSWAITNNYGHDCNGKGYIAGWDVENEGNLIAWNTTENVVGHLKGEGHNLYDCAFVDNNCLEVRADADGVVDVLTTCPSGIPEAPTHVTVAANEQKNLVTIEWDDASSNEIGFRVDRKLSDTSDWSPIAYRPRNSVGHMNNEQKWVDYMLPKGKTANYRVVAVNCSDSDEGASKSSSTVFLRAKQDSLRFWPDTNEIYSDTVYVRLFSDTEAVTVYYTLDGSIPTEASGILHPDDSLLLTESSTLTAFAVKKAFFNSDTVSLTYQVTQTSSISSKNTTDLHYFPNPVNDMLYIEGKFTDLPVKTSVFNAIGKLLSTQIIHPVNNFQIVLDTNELMPGEYFILLEQRKQKEWLTIIKE